MINTNKLVVAILLLVVVMVTIKSCNIPTDKIDEIDRIDSIDDIHNRELI